MNAARTLLAFIAVFVTASCSDTVTSHYPTRADAEADSLFKRGWLPDIIPASSREIVTKNDLDLNVSEGEFSFDPDDATEFLRHLSGGAGKEASSYSYTDTGSTWVFDIDIEEGHCDYSMSYRRTSKSESGRREN